MATLLDIANQVGVAKSTVSRALRGDPTLSIAEATRARIYDAAREMDYKVKKEKLLIKSAGLGVIHKDTHFLDQMDNSYYFSARYGIENACLSRNIQCSFVPLGFLHHISPVLDGAVIMGNFEKSQIEEICMHTKGIPLAFIGKINYRPRQMDWISYDVKSCVDIAMGYLLETGHRRVMYIGGKDVPGTPGEYHKLFYFRQFLAAHPEMVCQDVLEGEHGAQSGYELSRAWLQDKKELPQGIFVSNDPIAFGVLRGLAENGIHVPGEVSVISINGDGPGQSTAPPLTTVDIHTADMGREAVACLMEQLEGKRSVMKKVLFAPELVRRQSVEERPVSR